MSRTLCFVRMIAAYVATIVLFVTAVPGMALVGKRIADVSRRIDELGSRFGNVTQLMDDNAERINDCLYGVKRCRSPRWKGVRNGLDKFNSGLDKVGSAFDKAGDKLQDGIATK